ncbi:MAG: PilC/PilY family type IV pilus protein [Burkholderiales bacterium]|nr:PilC/PilY family type IV pilus protein [Burkholderiales bacterium]
MLLGLGLGTTMFWAGLAHATVSQIPLFVSSNARPNVLVILDNSNSMDEAPDGSAVGSNSPNSKSEIARSVLRSLVTAYQDRINLGLMAYRQNNPSAYHLHNSPYDVSYNPENYNPSFSGPRNSTTKKFRIPNPTDPGRYIYYNVTLPFYDSSNMGNGFCYSPTASFDNGSEIYPSGPWDVYRCFSTKTGTSDAVVSPLPTGGIKAAEIALGYNTLIYHGAFYPTDSDLAQGILDFGKLNAWVYVGRTWFRNDSPGRGYLHVPIKFLNPTQVNTILDKLKCNIPTQPPPCSSSGIPNAGLTPIEGTLLTARDYFQGGWTNTSEGYTAGAYPLPESCGKNFVVLLTDGLPSTDKNGNPLSNPAVALAQAASAAAALKAIGVETYVIGFALPYGTDPSTLDTLAVAGGTERSYYATDHASLNAVFSTIFADIMAKSGAAAALATNSTKLDTHTIVYQAKFRTTDWSGRLVAYRLTADGRLASRSCPASGYKEENDSGGCWDIAWEAAEQLPAHNLRKIFTYDNTTGTGIEFGWHALNSGQKAHLGNNAAVLNYLRGDASGEQRNGGSFRNREVRLGDIVNSDPVHVGVDEDYGYKRLPATEGTSYPAFVAAKSSRAKMLYVGANDGMLHGFDAATGVERLAYVPNAVFPNLINLTSPAYNSTTHHRYYVDGSPWVGDAYFRRGAESAPSWRTVLVGTTGAGGQAVFALDVTNPTAFSASHVLWEFTHAELGYTIGQALIARLNNGRWAAVFGNGYGSTGGRAKLFIVYLDANPGDGWQAGADYLILDTNTSSANGLSTPTLYDQNGDGIVDYVYAGDLQGNVWKFDLTHTNASLWRVVHGTPGAPQPFFTARNASNQPQPITAPIEIGPPPAGKTGVMLYFGTGSYYAVGDNSDLKVQSLYGLLDEGGTGTITYPCSVSSCNRNGVLQAQAFTHESTAHGHKVRVSSNNAVDYTSKLGWYLDLQPPAGSAQGERVVSAPLLRHGRVIFSSIVPSNSPCSFGGESWLIEVQATTGTRPQEPVLDLNNDGQFGSADKISVTIDGILQTVPISAIGSKVGLIKTPTVLFLTSNEAKLMSGSSGQIQRVGEATDPRRFGRISWQELLD